MGERVARKHPAAHGFRRTRADHESEITEDYVEAIAEIERQRGQCRGVDLRRLFGVSHATVTQTVARLKEAGLVDPEPYGPIRLTRAGLRLAEKSQQRHEIVFQFLLALGVSEEAARLDTEGIEHHVSEETLACFRQFIDRAGATSPPVPRRSIRDK